MNEAERWFEEGNIPLAVIRLESVLLEGKRPSVDMLERLPAAYLENSPLLQKTYGELLFADGKLMQAKEALQQAVKGFARQTFQKELLASIATLASVCLRLGERHEAETALSFLKSEYISEEAAIDGHTPLALARGARVIRDEANRKMYYQAAFERFDSDGDAEYGCSVLLEMLIDLGATLGHRAAEMHAMLEQRRLRSPEFGRFADTYAAIRLFQQERWKEAAETFGRIDGGHYPYYLALTIQLYRVIALARSGGSVRHDEVQALEKQCQLYGFDSGLQFLAARLRFELHLAEGDLEGAKRALRHAKDCWTLCESAYGGQPAKELEKLLAERLKQTEDSGRHAFSWRVECFGGMKFLRNAEEVRDIRWKRKKAQELFIYLLLQPYYAAPRDQLTEILFAEGDADKQSNQLYVVIHQLKQVLREHLGADGAIITKDGNVKIAEAVIEQTDVEKYRTLVRVGDQLWATDRELSAELYAQAVALYGELLPEIQYVDWLEKARDNYAELQSEALRKLIQWSAEQSDYEAAEGHCHEWIRLRPAQEEAYQELLRLLMRQGKRAEAKRWYRRLEAICRDELQTEPLAETKQLLSR